MQFYYFTTYTNFKYKNTVDTRGIKIQLLNRMPYNLGYDGTGEMIGFC